MSEVRDSTEEQEKESAGDTPKYSLKVKKHIEIKNTAQVVKDAHEVDLNDTLCVTFMKMTYKGHKKLFFIFFLYFITV